MLPVMENRDTPVSMCTSRSEHEREKEFLTLLAKVHNPAPRLIEELFRCLQSWWQEVGPSNTLQHAVCKKLLIDERVFTIYRHCHALIEMMESLRKGEPIRRVREHWDFSPEARRWWHALLIIRVLLKCDGALSHVRLVRWLSHRADAGQLRQALEYLRGSGIVETFYVNGTDPLRPMTWHRVVGIARDSTSKVDVAQTEFGI